MFATTDAYWMQYLRTSESQLQKQIAQKDNVKQNATHVVKVSAKHQEEMQRVLRKCSKETREYLAPMLCSPLACSLLWHIYQVERSSIGQLSNYDGTSSLPSDTSVPSRTEHTATVAPASNGPETVARTEDELVAARIEQRLASDPDLKATLDGFLDTVEEKANLLNKAFDEVVEASQLAVSEEGVRNMVDQSSKRTWRDLAPNDLAERLQRGEVITREEWVPGVTGDRRSLKPDEVAAHLKFGEQLHKEGNAAFKAENFPLALTRYTQGVNLVNWVVGFDKDSSRELEALHLLFLKNQALAALKTGEYQLAKRAAGNAILIDEHDGKARHRRAEACIYLGELVEAKEDLIMILKSPFTDSDAHAAARQSLRKIKDIVTAWKTNVSSIMAKSSADDVFSSNRDVNTSRVVQPELPPTGPIFPYIGRDLHKNTYSSMLKLASRRPCNVNPRGTVAEELQRPIIEETEKPQLDEESTLSLLESILACYTHDSTQRRLNEARRAADFEERRILIRGRRLLPELLGPILDEWEFPGESFEEKKRAMEKCVMYWRSRSREVRHVSKEIYKAYMGDVLDDDIADLEENTGGS